MAPVTESDRPRTALVAGGSGALGSALVELLLGRGEQVCVPWIVETEAEALRATYGEAVRDGTLRLSECDVADPDQVAALLDVLGDLKAQGRRIAAYGAAAKGNTLLNYAGVRTDFIDYTVDQFQAQGQRQARFTFGMQAILSPVEVRPILTGRNLWGDYNCRIF
jgi:NAD(P)-dependent dehydrogenase (short-subunit alcohol dehydrogenase family)